MDVQTLRKPVKIGSGDVPASVGTGNAFLDGNLSKGWFIGHFMPVNSPQHTTDIETKWAVNKAGKTNGEVAVNAVATSMAILISGMQRIEFEGFDVLLKNQGDYVIWGPGVKHSWTAVEDTVILCIRWPSRSGDQSAVGETLPDHGGAVIREAPQLAVGNVTDEARKGFASSS